MTMHRLLLLFVLFSAYTFAEPPVYIGLDADMSAVAKEGGEAIQRGALIAIDDINAQGGVLGRPLQLVVKDHRGNPARGIANMQQFAKLTDLVAVLGGVHTPVALKELPVIHEHKLIYLDPWAAGTPVVDNGYQPNYVFRISVRDAEAGKVLVAHAKARGAKRIGLLLERTGWGRSNETSMTTAADALGIEVVTPQWFNWRQKDMRQAIDTLYEDGAEAILMVANAPEGATAANALLAHPEAHALPLIAHWGIASGTFVERVGLDALAKLDIAVLQTYSFDHARNQKLNAHVLAQYRQRFAPDIDARALPGAVGTAHAYDLVRLLAMAIEQAGSLASSEVRTALENIESYEGLIKHYQPPFTAERHDALFAEDYILSTFDDQGRLIPIRK